MTKPSELDLDVPDDALARQQRDPVVADASLQRAARDLAFTNPALLGADPPPRKEAARGTLPGGAAPPSEPPSPPPAAQEPATAPASPPPAAPPPDPAPAPVQKPAPEPSPLPNPKIIVPEVSAPKPAGLQHPAEPEPFYERRFYLVAIAGVLIIAAAGIVVGSLLLDPAPPAPSVPTPPHRPRSRPAHGPTRPRPPQHRPRERCGPPHGYNPPDPSDRNDPHHRPPP